MAMFKPIETILGNLTEIPIKAGQLIICTDTNDIYTDTSDSERIPLTDIIKLDTESDRESIFVPLIGKIYLVKETNNLYNYNGLEWETISIDINISNQNIDYKKLVPGTIEKKGTSYAPATLASVVYTQKGEKVEDVLNSINNTKSSLASFKNSTTLTTKATEVNIGISQYNKDTDILFVYLNSTYLEEFEDYIILTNDMIQTIANAWNGEEEPQIFNFVVLKNVLTKYDGVIDGFNIKDNTISESKLTKELVDKLNKYETLILDLTKRIDYLESVQTSGLILTSDGDPIITHDDRNILTR